MSNQVHFYKDCLYENWKQTENNLMVENAWLKEKLRQKEAKLEKATEHLTELRLQQQREQLAQEELRERLKVLEENLKLKVAIEEPMGALKMSATAVTEAQQEIQKVSKPRRFD
jgi:predicted RecB family nuclease